jgi:fucose permease
VGTEQGIANWISQFLSDYHGYDAQTIGAKAVSRFWGLMTIGCMLGLLLLKFIDSKKVLLGFATLAIICLTLALFGSARISLFTFSFLGFTLSVMWSVIVSLALNSVDKRHGAFSGILCTGIAGGAVVPLIVGWIADLASLRVGMLFIYLTLGYVLAIGIWAKPIISNKTISLRKKRQES